MVLQALGWHVRRPSSTQLLSDFKLIATQEEWHALTEALGKVPTPEYRVYRSGIIFTVIGPPPPDGLLPGLTYSNSHREFLSESVKLSESIMPMEDDFAIDSLFANSLERKKHPFFTHPKWVDLPKVSFRPGDGGYELGLEVHLDWWEKLCKTGQVGELAKIKDDKDHLCGTTRLPIATFPYSEFSVYYEGVNYDGSRKQQEARDKHLEARGWKRKDRHDPEISDPWSRVEHKYFVVEHRTV